MSSFGLMPWPYAVTKVVDCVVAQPLVALELGYQPPSAIHSSRSELEKRFDYMKCAFSCRMSRRVWRKSPTKPLSMNSM